MEYLIGVLSTAALFLCVYGAYRLGQRSHKTLPKEIDEQQAERAKRLRKGFEDVMSYDVSKALSRKE